MAVSDDDARDPARSAAAAATPVSAGRRTRHGDLAEDMIERIVGYRLAMASIPTRQLFNRHVGQVLKLRPVDFTLLALIRANPHVTAKRLSLALAISAPRLTPILDRLQKRGLIRRERSEADRRAQHIALTEQGDGTVARGLELSLRAEDAYFAALSPAERAMLGELLAKVAAMVPK